MLNIKNKLYYLGRHKYSMGTIISKHVNIKFYKSNRKKAKVVK